jgi:hypothetical protein
MSVPVSLIQRREIEAGIAASLIRGFIKEFGKERAMGTATEVIESLALEAGRQIAEKYGGNTLIDLGRVVREFWAQDGALEIEFLEETESVLRFNVIRCRYSETYESMGIRDIGYCLSCSRDAKFAAGFNREIKMERTQTIMQGAPYCDYFFHL